MSFDSLDQIKREFGIDESSPGAIRDELRKRMAEIHPDATEGDSATPSDEEKWKSLEEAISFIETEDSQKMIPLEEVSELVKTVNDLAISGDHNNIQDRFDKQVTSKKNDLESYARTPRITSAIIATLLTALWTFPEVTEGHPVLSQYIDAESYSFSLVWLTSIGFTFFLWLLTSMVEKRKRSVLSALQSKRVQNDLFAQFVKEIDGPDRDQELLFMRSDVIHFSLERIRPKIQGPFSVFLKPLGGSDVENLDLIETFVDSVLARAEKKNLVERTDVESLETQFRIIVDPRDIAKPPKTDLFRR